jgi:hypothetical protein
VLREEEKELWDLSDDNDLDVDRWEMVLTPDDYLARFKDPLAEVALVNWVPYRKMETTYHRGPNFGTVAVGGRGRSSNMGPSSLRERFLRGTRSMPNSSARSATRPGKHRKAQNILLRLHTLPEPVWL